MTARGQANAPAGCLRLVAWIALVLPAWFSGVAWATQSGPARHASSVRITEAITRYTLDATSIDGLRSQLHHDLHLPRGKAGTHARTRSDIAIAYEVDGSAAGCRLRHLEVRLDIVVTLPEWAPGEAVPDWQYARWKRTLAALERHEATHRANARAAARGGARPHRRDRSTAGLQLGQEHGQPRAAQDHAQVRNAGSALRCQDTQWHRGRCGALNRGVRRPTKAGRSAIAKTSHHR